MIVGTAGHIDHGKTTLVRALTGVDTDRLPEEKRRGITIELGYAFMDLPDGPRIGFVDVPGHERLVHTMLSGATGMDAALLLVAADDGIMPQTREHLAVLCLLNLPAGRVVITKADRASPERLQQVQSEVAALVAGTPFAQQAPWVVSAQTGQGVSEIRQGLAALAASASAHPRHHEAFRLAVDRVFSLDGVGTVVTGSIHAGQVQVGDQLCLSPGGQAVRVRSLHAQNQAVERAHAGQRCAVGLVGVDKQQVQRGQWLVDPRVSLQTDRFDVDLTLWHEESKPLRSGSPVHVHIGSVSTMGSVVLLQEAALLPGQQALAQVVLKSPVGAWHGDKVVLRDAAASRTLAGGRVLDPFAPARYRRTPARLADLSAEQLPDAAERLRQRVAGAAMGLDLSQWCRGQGLAEAPHLPDLLTLGDCLMSTQVAEQLLQGVMAALAAFHQRAPEEMGPDSARLRRLALPRCSLSVWQNLLAHWVAQGWVAQRAGLVHLPAHGVKLSQTEERLAQKLAPHLAEAGFEGAWVRDMARDASESEALVRLTLARLAQRGELHQVVKDLYYPVSTMQRLAKLARLVAEQSEGVVTAARFRDVTCLGRKRAIQILEYFDRVGLLRRVGDEHKLRLDCSLFEASAEAASH